MSLKRASFFESREVKRVGIASTLMIAGVIAVVLTLLPVFGYSSLAQAFPKSIVDGGVVGLLVGLSGRWRTLILLGAVVGLFLGTVMPAIPVLFVVYGVAGLLAAFAGKSFDSIDRRCAIAVAGLVFTTIAGGLFPLQVILGTKEGDEPILWMFYGLECFVRVPGSIIGGMLAVRYLHAPKRAKPAVQTLRQQPADAIPQTKLSDDPAQSPRRSESSKSARRKRSRDPYLAAFLLVMTVLGSTLLLAVENAMILGSVVCIYISIALAMRKPLAVVVVSLTLLWTWAIFATASYVWHQDLDRVVDLGRTLFLRFFPMTMGAVLIVSSVSPVAMFKVLRVARLPGVLLLPFSQILRAAPLLTRDIKSRSDQLRKQGIWQGRFFPLRRPVFTAKNVLLPSVWSLIDELR